MQKERLFYLDFIRAISVIIIVLTHYNAVYIYMWNPEVLNKVIISTKIANIYIGDFGVSLFLIISGAALMYVYEQKLDMINFYKKRFLRLYPMFWLTYGFAFIYSVFLEGNNFQYIPKSHFLLTIAGFDGYLCEITSTFYLVGEWFLGLIILIYIIFPVLRVGVKRCPIIISMIVGVLYIGLYFYYPFMINRSIFLFTRLPEVLFGMIFVKYMKESNVYLALGGTLVLILNSIIHPMFSKDIQTTYIGISAFLLLAYLGTRFEKWNIIKKGSIIVSKYSYAVFLTHHYLIKIITDRFNLISMTVLQSYGVFVLCCIAIIVCSKGIYALNDLILKLVSRKKV